MDHGTVRGGFRAGPREGHEPGRLHCHDSEPFGMPDDCTSEWMLAPALDAGGNRDQSSLSGVAERHHIRNFRLSARDRPGLVHGNDPHAGEAFQVNPALDQDASAGRGTE